MLPSGRLRQDEELEALREVLAPPKKKSLSRGRRNCTNEIGGWLPGPRNGKTGFRPNFCSPAIVTALKEPKSYFFYPPPPQATDAIFFFRVCDSLGSNIVY